MMVKILVIAIVALVLVEQVLSRYAHTTVNIEPYIIEAGWNIEPPIVWIKNDIAIKVLEPGETTGTVKGVTNVFRDANMSVFLGVHPNRSVLVLIPDQDTTFHR